MKKLAPAHVLTRIVEAKKKRLRDAGIRVPNAIVRKMALSAPGVISFRSVLERDHRTRIIAEIKKASPSAGVLVERMDVEGLARSYAESGAVAISVVTEQDFFQGSLAWIGMAAKASGLPVLRKDFIFDSYQLAETRAAGASAVLLIAAMLEPEDLQSLLEGCVELGLDALVEVHDEAELSEALEAGASILGVNNRDLKTFDVDLETGVRLGRQIPKGVIFVAESGIRNRNDVQRLREAGAAAFLVGEQLIRSGNPQAAMRDLL